MIAPFSLHSSKLEGLVRSLAPGINLNYLVGRPIARPSFPTDEEPESGLLPDGFEAVAIKGKDGWTLGEGSKTIFSNGASSDVGETDPDLTRSAFFGRSAAWEELIGETAESDRKLICCATFSLPLYLSLSLSIQLLIAPGDSIVEKGEAGTNESEPNFPPVPVEAIFDANIALQAFPEPGQLQRLVDSYFRFPHLIFPILSESRFRERLLDLDLVKKNKTYLALLYSVLALSTLYLEETDKEKTLELVDLGMKWSSLSRFLLLDELEPSTLCHHQSFLLFAVYCQGSRPLWQQTTSTLSHLATSIITSGSHFKSNFKFTSNPTLLESYSKIFWIASLLDTSISVSFGRPLSIQWVELSAKSQW